MISNCYFLSSIHCLTSKSETDMWCLKMYYKIALFCDVQVSTSTLHGSQRIVDCGPHRQQSGRQLDQDPLLMNGAARLRHGIVKSNTLAALNPEIRARAAIAAGASLLETDDTFQLRWRPLILPPLLLTLSTATQPAVTTPSASYKIYLLEQILDSARINRIKYQI